MAELEVRFFALLRQRAGVERVWVDAPLPATVGELRLKLMQQFPGASREIEQALAAVDREFAGNADGIKAGVEVAFFPPVSGG